MGAGDREQVRPGHAQGPVETQRSRAQCPRPAPFPSAPTAVPPLTAAGPATPGDVPSLGHDHPIPVAAASGQRRRGFLRPGLTCSVKRFTLSPVESLF